ncbi:Mss4p nuclear export [Coemansia sp. RSA 921]|nr:Mss4p nuclear export [Coemansia sp. RSA 1824]KAJ1782925.1 Mss4p nuclear export [Coemansia sp. RSA 1938]KAJ2107873.1 Mss4p nuclear export [Coemansia sp. RSA 921]KAJ2139291.1 Mss4p nuclear export [Coemansia sp. RSA 788]KAJ2141839.1 Mss4p nuclear export [Coemansia sp. RSA 564]KAJ2258094.1 Mss4p nuclear export [Coemansia sp. RSA 454]KAJ2294333.1 Mss4p nuclear export [Coemansia sp. RSA 355]KAJ2430371.1 Mss4p nuclear export [Coemansia sp. RSA 2524]KAJ2512764.1 Mss4p nuclear export [Coemansia s
MGEKRAHASESESDSESDKQLTHTDNESNRQLTHTDSEEDGSDNDSMGSNEIVNVDFEFFDPQPIDFHAMKRMFEGSFGDDSDQFNTSALVDLILSQPSIGSTVKMDDDSDPYAFMTALSTRRDSEPIKQVCEYLVRKAGPKAQTLSELLDKHHVGLLFSERVINMPPQVVVPMLRMLMTELEKEDGFDFEYFVLVCSMYSEVPADDGAKACEMDVFVHAEEEFIEEFAHITFDFKFTRLKRVAEARNTFADAGLAPSRRCLVIHRSKIDAILARLEDVLEL